MAWQYQEFNYIENINVSAADWTIPDGVRIGELRCTTAGTIKADSNASAGVNLLVTDYDIVNASITKIYKTGTDAGLQSGKITVYGWKNV